jgi:two-component system, response regulator RegA
MLDFSGGSPMRPVLLVDDSALVRRVLARRLATEGFEVREEGSVAGAREADPTDLVCAVIDLELSDGEGAELAATLLGACPSLRVAFFTASAGAELVERARELGPVFDKSSPKDIDKIVDWVRSVARDG